MLFAVAFAFDFALAVAGGAAVPAALGVEVCRRRIDIAVIKTMKLRAAKIIHTNGTQTWFTM